MGFEVLFDQLQQAKGQGMAVAWAADPPVLEAAADAAGLGLVSSVFLTGRSEAIAQASDQAGVDISTFEIIEATNPKEAAAAAVAKIRTGEASILMKGLLSTGVLLQAVLDKETGLRKKPLLSHIGVLQFADGSLRLLTDGGMNIAPTLEQKVQILENAGELAIRLGITRPKAALLAAVETVNPKMQETLDAAIIVKMAQRGQLAVDMDVDGPLALDNAISKEAAEHKGITGPVAGAADILVVPEITSGNVLYKSMVYLAHLPSAGVVWGAACPVVLTSRADSREAKLNSIAVACKAGS